MNNRERFKAVANFEKPDYVPIFGFMGAWGMSGGLFKPDHEKLVQEGMPSYVGGYTDKDGNHDIESWEKYWGTVTPLFISDLPAEHSFKDIESKSKIVNGYEVIEYESGAVTRQVIENDTTYSMPEFKSFHVTDRKSWEFYRDKTAPGKKWTDKEMKEHYKHYLTREKPLAINLCGTWGANIRGIMGPEKACTILYDDPGLAKEILNYYANINEEYFFPLIEYLKPEAVCLGEDICYKNGMLISPGQFREFSFPTYRAINEVVQDNKIDMLSVDTDGNAMDFVPLVRECGVNSIHPFEVKGGNDLFLLREKYPDFILHGWLEKEVVNKGNGHLIEEEIMSKVPPLLEKGGYFPNGDHGLQPMVTYKNLCKFMTILHEVTGNPEGDFPRTK